MSRLTAPAGETLAYTDDSPLPLSTTWNGAVADSVTRSFDSDFRVAPETVGGTADVSFACDGYPTWPGFRVSGQEDGHARETRGSP